MRGRSRLPAASAVPTYKPSAAAEWYGGLRDNVVRELGA